MKADCPVEMNPVRNIEFLQYIRKNCIVDEISGDPVCKKCGHTVHIDWFEQKLECSGCDEL